MVERIKKARLIYNPTSGQEIIKKNIAEVLDVLEDVAMKLALIKRLQNHFLPKMKQKEPLRQALI